MVQVVLVDQTHSIDAALLNDAAMALTQQVTEDLAPVWAGISANVSVAPSLKAVPVGAWPVFLVASLPPGEGGFHLDKHNQPYAKVIASAVDESWTIDASHEIIEMLVDPAGNRMQASQAIAIQSDGVVDAPGTFNYLVEACDPCEANQFGYEINGILVSDFITPNFYDASVTPGTSYSFKGNITRPRQMLVGGYISYVQPDGSWNQILWVNPGDPVYNNPNIAGALDQGVSSLRETIHRAMGKNIDAQKHNVRRETTPASANARSAARLSMHRDAGDEKRLMAWYKLDMATTKQPPAMAFDKSPA